MKTIKSFLTLIAVAILSIGTAVAQAKLQGVVVEASSNEALAGVAVSIQGTTNGVITDANGAFSITAEKSTGVLAASSIGFQTQTISFNGAKSNIKISLEEDVYSLEDVVVVGTGVIDIAEDRSTPIAVSTILIEDIQKKTGNKEFPEIMANTPSIYVGSQAGGYGDARINIRGFSQENIALLFNGQPVNGMEDGKVYWSNWSGLSDIASVVQIQRGLGSSKLAISSVGATINVVTKATDKKQGGSVKVTTGNDGYKKVIAQYSTGMTESGWGVSALASHWEGDGYNEGTQGAGETYFISIGHQLNENHKFNFSYTTAPQWHNQKYKESISEHLEYGFKYNGNWGYLDGEVFTWRRNFYSKPVMNLNWDWNITENTTLSTVAYYSTGTGGGTGSYGKGWYNTDENGQVDFDGLYAKNSATVDDDGNNYGSYGQGNAVRRASMNLHNWKGIVTNLNSQINENWAINLGVDYRNYFGEHFRLVENLMGLDGYWDDNYNGAGFKVQYPDGFLYTNEHEASRYFNSSDKHLSTIDKLDYYNSEQINYVGGFGQLEYTSDKVSAFIQGALSQQTNQRFDFHSYADPDEQVSEKLKNLGANLKLGANYNINETHNVFVNGGYYSRQPFQDDLFLNYNNTINTAVGNESVLGLEAGYGFRSYSVNFDLNTYYTKWGDRQIRSTIYGYNGTNDNASVIYENVEEIHYGVELEATTKPLHNLEISGFFSLGSWEYGNAPDYQIFDEDQNLVEEGNLDLSGYKVGDAAQTSLGLSGNWYITNEFSLDLDYRHYAKLYASLDPVSGTSENLELPSYGLTDFGASYSYKLNKGNNTLFVRANVNNLFDVRYISESSTNIIAEDGDETWNGVDVANTVYFGNGTTWNFSLGFKF